MKILMLALFLPAIALSQECKTRKEVTGACFTVNGALRAYNGNPTFRIWKIGTKNILGVRGFGELPDENPDFPEAIKAKVNPAKLVDRKSQLCGKYTVCPLSTCKKGSMQSVCIEDGQEILEVPYGDACSKRATAR